MSGHYHVGLLSRKPVFGVSNQVRLKPDGSAGHIGQLVSCLTADPGVVSSIPAWSHTFVEIDDHEIISTVILLPSPDSKRVVVSYKRKYIHEVLVNR